jgi:flagellar hook-basal body complex protein FliE
MSDATIGAIQSMVMDTTQALARVSTIATYEARPSISFGEMLNSSIAAVNRQVIEANGIAAAFTLDDSIPPHQVMVQLEQAKLSMQLMMQVRARLVEGYQEFMRMQL